MSKELRKITPLRIIGELTTKFDADKLDKPYMAVQCFAQASAVSTAIQQNYNYLSTIIDHNLLDVTIRTLSFLSNAVKDIKG